MCTNSWDLSAEFWFCQGLSVRDSLQPDKNWKRIISPSWTSTFHVFFRRIQVGGRNLKMKLNLLYLHKNDCFRVLFSNVWVKGKKLIWDILTCAHLIWASSIISGKLSEGTFRSDSKDCPQALIGNEPAAHSILIKSPCQERRLWGQAGFGGAMCSGSCSIFTEPFEIIAAGVDI